MLVRIATKEPPKLYQNAASSLEKAEADGRVVWVHPMHLAEVTFVSQKVYGHAREQISQDLLAGCWIQVVRLHDQSEAVAALAL